MIDEKVISADDLTKLIKEFKDLLEEQFKSAKNYQPKIEWFEGTWSRYKPKKGKDKRGVTGFSVEKLTEISNKIHSLKSDLNTHKTINKIFEFRKQSLIKGENIDWSTAETLAFGSLLTEGFPVRLVGQDSEEEHSVKGILFLEIKLIIQDIFH